MRCDLHVHTRYSGPVDLPGLRHVTRECYSDPMEVYLAAKRRGMDLVTITDHDTIEGALQLAHLPDFIIGEEVTCEIAPGREIHLGIWDLTENRHESIAARRRDPESLFAWLAENRVPACINHPFSPLTGRREVSDFHRAFQNLALIEAHNGMMPAATNEFARLAGRREGLAPVGGSDAHTLEGVAHAFTTVPRATDRHEFLEGLRAGFTVPAGGAGSYGRLTGAVFRVFGGALLESSSFALRSLRDFGRFTAVASALPLMAIAPLVTLLSYVHESWGGRDHHASYLRSRSVNPARKRSLLGPRLVFGGEA
jgi:predicted metal-dependent phosphoesterase TrpH